MRSTITCHMLVVSSLSSFPAVDLGDRLAPSPSLARLIQRYPAMGWKEALPLGNGALAALLYGRIGTETIAFNHERLWGGGSTPTMPDVSAILPDLRHLLDERKYAEAETLYRDELRKRGYSDATVAAFMPGPDLILSTRLDHGFSDYRRELELSTGETLVTWKEGETLFHRRAFISAAADLFVLECGVPAECTRPYKVSLAPHDFRDRLTQHLTLLSLAPVVKHSSFPNGNSIEVDLGNGCRYAAAFLFQGAMRLEESEGVATLAFGPETLILATVAPLDGEGAADGASLYERLEHHVANGGDYTTLSTQHREAFAKMQPSVNFDLRCPPEEREMSNEELLLKAYDGTLPNALAERMFHYGRYLLACSSRPSSLPAHLQGAWNGDYSPPWRCAFFNNENLQMSYWQALPGNLGSALLPIFDLYESRMDDFRINARHLFGCRGIVLPLYMSPESGLQKDLQTHVLHWTGAGAWLSQLYWEYWLFTRDRRFLRDRAVPFMQEVARFYEDYIILNASGEAVIYPGNSPENRALPHRTAICINATMDIALVRELLGNLTAAFIELDLSDDEAKLEKWALLLQRLPSYQINQDGALKEWLHSDFEENYHHRHISHIYPFFPGHEVPPTPGAPLFEAVKTAVEKRMTIGLGDQTGWSLAHLANIFGRLGDGEKAWSCLGYLAQSCTGQSLFTYHNDVRGMGMTMPMHYGTAAPLQLDANLCYPSAVIEMLLYSSSEELRLLPALPMAWARGEISRLQTRCGVEVFMQWDLERKEMAFELFASIGTTLKFRLPPALIANDSATGMYGGKLTLEEGDRVAFILKEGVLHRKHTVARIQRTNT